MSDTPFIEVRDLTCARAERVLFEALSLELRPGELLQVTGDNGSGKTTLLRTICGLTRARLGQVLWQGAPIETVRAAFLAAIHYVGHTTGIKLELTPWENLSIAQTLSTRPKAVRPDEILAKLGLTAQSQLAARRLSAGQRQRIALGRLLAVAVDVWILDEPFTALDQRGIKFIANTFEEHLEAGGAILLTSHQAPPTTRYPVRQLRLGA